MTRGAKPALTRPLGGMRWDLARARVDTERLVCLSTETTHGHAVFGLSQKPWETTERAQWLVWALLRTIGDAAADAILNGEADMHAEYDEKSYIHG
jgi:hypothetical protein